MQSEVYRYLRFSEFKNVFQWDLKRYLNKPFKSKFSIVELGTHIKEENKKHAISEEGKQYGILGVNNQTGIFDAYSEDGSKIRQKYKRMDTGWIAYNPYRVNVGSIGIKKQEHRYEYISPAYVVFSCLPSLLPDYLFLVMKTPVFNRIIRDSTTGSVRQNLSYDVLKGLQIPLPTVPEQQALVKGYNEKLLKARVLEEKASQIEKEIEEYLLNELKVSTTKVKLHNGLNLMQFRDIERWDCYNTKAIGKSTVYQNTILSQVILSKPQYGAGFSSKEYDGKTRYIRITDINEDGSLTEDMVSAMGFSEQYLLKEDDFLIARSGNTVGKTFLYKEKLGTAIYAGYLIKFELDTEIISPKYLLYYTKCSVYKNWINSNMRVSAQPNINSQQYLSSPVILPPIDIQNAIVEHIDKQKKQIMTLKRQAEALRKEALEEFEKEIFE